MPYIGQSPATGEANSFKTLDNIASYTLTFDGSSASTVSVANDTITERNHRFVTGQRVTYNDGGGTSITGLSDGVYYIIVEDKHTIKLATNANNAAAGTAINLTGLGVGSSHTLNVAFDGVNTKFKATVNNGTRADITSAPQVMLSINGVLQQPHNNTTSPTTGYAVDHTSTIIFSAAPATSDQFFASLVASSAPTFDISDNVVDNFTGDGSTTDFTLSKAPPNNESVLVTIDGVVQYPDDTGAVRAYTVSENILTFASAPGSAVEIQVRHIGFAGASTGGISGFYGRTGNAVLKNTDNIVFNNATASGTVQAANVTVTGDLTVNGTTTTLDTELTSVDKLEVDANNTTVAAAITQRGNGDILNLYDGGTEVFSVLDGGAVRIGGNAVSGAAAGVVLQDGTGVIATRSSGSSPVFRGYTQGDSSANFTVKADGKLLLGTETEGDNSADNLTIADSGNSGITIRSGTSNQGSIFFSDATSGSGEYDGFIQYSQNDRWLKFGTATSTSLTITSGGLIGIGTVTPESNSRLHTFTTQTTARTITETTSASGYAGYRLTNGTGYWEMQVDGSNQGLRFLDDGTEKFRITSAGELISTNGTLRRNVSDSSFTVSGDTASNTGANINLYGASHSSLANVFRVRVGASEKFRIDSAGRLLLGTETEGQANADNLTIADNNNCGITIRSGSTSGGAIYFSDGTSGGAEYDGYIEYSQNSRFMRFGTATTERLRITSAGLVDISGGVQVSENVTPTSGAGLELFREGNGGGQIQAYDRDNSTSLPLILKGSQIQIFASGSERLRIDSDGRLTAGGATTSNAWAGGDDLILGNTNSGTRTGITLVSHSGSDGGIYWSDGTGTNVYRGQLAYNHANDTMSLYTAAAARLRITSGGIVLINDANVSTSRADAPLQIETGANGNALNLRARAGDNIYSYLNFQNTAGSQTAAHIYLQRDASNNAGTLVFGTAAASANTPTERLYITSTGQLLHGVASNSVGYNLVTSGANYHSILVGSTNGGSAGLILDGAANGDGSGSDYGSIEHVSTGEMRYKNRQSSGSGGAGHIFYTTNSDTERLRITSDGRMHIGYNAGSNAGTDQVNIVAAGSGLQIARTQASSPSVNEWLGAIGFQGYLSSNSTSSADARIHARAAAHHSGTSAPTDLIFSTKPAGTGPGSAPADRMIITANGQITSGNISINGYQYQDNNVTGYTQVASDNHANSFFGQNLKLGASGGSGSHTLEVINQHGSIGGAGMYIGGNSNTSRANAVTFYAVASNQSAGTDVTNMDRLRITTDNTYFWTQPTNYYNSGQTYIRTFGFTFNLQDGETETLFYNPDSYRRIWYEMYFQSGHGSNGYGYILANISRYGMLVHDVDWHVSHTSYAFSGSVGGNVNHNGFKLTRSGYANTNINYYAIIKCFSPAGGSPFSTSGLTDASYRYYSQGF